jgi:hypothetical protein
VGLDNLERGELSPTNAFGNLVESGKGGGVHGPMRESMRETGEGQAGRRKHS